MEGRIGEDGVVSILSDWGYGAGLNHPPHTFSNPKNHLTSEIVEFNKCLMSYRLQEICERCDYLKSLQGVKICLLDYIQLGDPKNFKDFGRALMLATIIVDEDLKTIDCLKYLLPGELETMPQVETQNKLPIPKDCPWVMEQTVLGQEGE